MTDYLTEQEQIELLKNWIKQYSLVILAGVLIAALTITGWRYWQKRQNKISNHASAIYDEMLTMRSQGNDKATQAGASKLLNQYPQTTYSLMAAFMLAREAIAKGNFGQAEKHLKWIVDNSKIPAFRQIARLRLARVFLAKQTPQMSLTILQKVEDSNFTGLIEEVKGDAFLAMNDISMARKSYQLALAELPNAEVVRPILQMKFDNLRTDS